MVLGHALSVRREVVRGLYVAMSMVRVFGIDDCRLNAGGSTSTQERYGPRISKERSFRHV